MTVTLHSDAHYEAMVSLVMELLSNWGLLTFYMLMLMDMDRVCYTCRDLRVSSLAKFSVTVEVVINMYIIFLKNSLGHARIRTHVSQMRSGLFSHWVITVCVYKKLLPLTSASDSVRLLGSKVTYVLSLVGG